MPATSCTTRPALKKPGAFAGRSQLKTWLIGVLKHKVIDQLRRHGREATVLSTEDGEDLDESLFDRTGHWSNKPQDWGSPEAACGQRRFFEVALNAAKGKTDSLNHWAVAVQSRRGYWEAVVAIAAKNVRLCWAVLSRGEAFKLPA